MYSMQAKITDNAGDRDLWVIGFFLYVRPGLHSAFTSPGGREVIRVSHSRRAVMQTQIFAIISSRSVSCPLSGCCHVEPCKMFVYAAEPEVAPADEPQAVAEGLLW